MARGRIADFRRSGFTEGDIRFTVTRAIFCVRRYFTCLGLFTRSGRPHRGGALPSPSRVGSLCSLLTRYYVGVSPSTI